MVSERVTVDLPPTPPAEGDEGVIEHVVDPDPPSILIWPSPRARTDPDEPARFIRSVLPMVVQWPRDATRRFLGMVYASYFRSVNQRAANRFRYSILVHRAETPREAVKALSLAGAFATQLGRDSLRAVVAEARLTLEEEGGPLCKRDVLDCLDRYATYAFVLEGATMTCGALPD
jgi:hypothetical protein